MHHLPWIAEAVGNLGVTEIPGARHNNKVLQFFRAVNATIRDDETPWCAAFVGHCLKEVGYPTSGSLAARSYETYGENLGSFRAGCIITMHRGNPKDWRGHTGFGIRLNAARTRILVLGGNQNNAVNLSWYPVARVTSYRWPPGAFVQAGLSARDIEYIESKMAAINDAADR
jgi:uncharacterized protein (TIGR02594 family)